MTIDEMREHKWSVSWSGGKDSTATIIKMLEHNVPIKEIIYIRMMWDDVLPATLPIMTDFVDKTINKLKCLTDADIKIVKSRPALDICNSTFKRSKVESRNGAKYGMSGFARGFCAFTSEKQNTIKKLQTNDYEMIGYTVDEKERIKRLGGKKQSILKELSVTQSDALKICADHDMLSPLYELGVTRDGCFFFPNVGKREREYLKDNYPELVNKIFEVCDYTLAGSIWNLRIRNNWIKEYIDYNIEKMNKKPEKPSKNDVLDNQINIFDYYKEGD